MGICIQQIRCGVKPPLLTTHAARETPAMSISLRFQRDVPERFPLFFLQPPRASFPIIFFSISLPRNCHPLTPLFFPNPESGIPLLLHSSLHPGPSSLPSLHSGTQTLRHFFDCRAAARPYTPVPCPSHLFTQTLSLVLLCYNAARGWHPGPMLRARGTSAADITDPGNE